MSLEDITLRRHGGMAGLVAGRYLIPNFDGIQIRGVPGGRLEACFIKARHPFLAAITGGLLVDGEFFHPV
jgi:hypothetical protein